MGNQRLGSFSQAFAEAIDNIRHEVVEVPMYGREVTSDISEFRQWLYGDTPKVEVEPEALGKETITIEAEPLEGRPYGTRKERDATAAAYDFHQEAGVSTLEIDDAHDQEWSEFEAWLEGKGHDKERGQENERELSGPELEI